jgi:hypothetical protein
MIPASFPGFNDEQPVAGLVHLPQVSLIQIGIAYDQANADTAHPVDTCLDKKPEQLQDPPRRYSCILFALFEGGMVSITGNSATEAGG